jgi:hypothetical protein
MHHIVSKFYFRLLSVFVLLCLLVQCAQNNHETSSLVNEDYLEIKVLVLNFDPVIGGENTPPLHEVYNWNNPRELADGYMAEIRKVSGEFIRYKIVQWQDVNAFPVKKDGFVYTPETFKECWENRETCHDPDGSDYSLLLERN